MLLFAMLCCIFFDLMIMVKKAVAAQGHCTVEDYISEQRRQLRAHLEAYDLQRQVYEEDLKYVIQEWSACVIRQLLHL